MKITRQALNKIYRMVILYPQLTSLYKSLEAFFKEVCILLSGYGEQYGFSKVLKVFQSVLFELEPDDFETRTKFLNTCREKLAQEIYRQFEAQEEESNNILTYFDEVKAIYDENENFQEEIEFIPENRDLFIKSNLKLVVSVAKKYINMGVPFMDLIGAGNVGLCLAFDKFNSKKNVIKESIIKDITTSPNSTWNINQVTELLSQYYTYGNMLDKLIKKVPKKGFASSADFKEWTKKNIKSAVFASVAFMWIRAYILIEINKTAHIVKLPTEAGEEMASKTRFVSIDEYNSDDDSPDFDFDSGDYEQFDDDLNEPYKKTYYQNTVSKLLTCLSPRERRIVIKKFGIGLPWSMRIQEIAEAENISASRCMSTYKEAVQKIISNTPKEMLAEIHELLRQ